MAALCFKRQQKQAMLDRKDNIEGITKAKCIRPSQTRCLIESFFNQLYNNLALVRSLQMKRTPLLFYQPRTLQRLVLWASLRSSVKT